MCMCFRVGHGDHSRHFALLPNHQVFQFVINTRFNQYVFKTGVLPAQVFPALQTIGNNSLLITLGKSFPWQQQ